MRPTRFLVVIYLLFVGSAFALRARTGHAGGITAADARGLNHPPTKLSRRAPPVRAAKTHVRTRPKRKKGWSGKRDKKQKPPKKPAPAPGPPSQDLLRGGKCGKPPGDGPGHCLFTVNGQRQFLDCCPEEKLKTMMRTVASAALLIGQTFAYDQLFNFKAAPVYETRSLDEIHQAALKEGGVVTVWHGGDEANQQDALKQAFETRFQGMTLNITVDLSKYHDGRLDQQLGDGNIYVDSIILQTLHDYPRWAQEGALLNYAPVSFDQIEHSFKDDTAAWYGLYVFFWSGAFNTEKLPGIEPLVEWNDWLRPEFKDKLVITYPNDDDAVTWAFYLVMRQYGTEWFDKVIAQNPRWVGGTQTPTLASAANTTSAAFFAGFGGFGSRGNLNFTVPKEGKYVSWPQTGVILKDTPHPEGAKLLHNFILTPEYQQATGLWPVRRDVAPPAGFPDLWTANATNPAEFARFMAGRPLVERLRFFFEAKLGTAVGLDLISDDI
ncbi:unnamed protein product [Clonostachys rhizophaga]|uniref:ABC-type Fe3+ transport system n=1 Tax=Clonostachys rhizophaga TaxID=160324 RepID=A0A9N9VRY4_9HYPO|nr:unnamed protein product [Clonostachys rhizophaga]